MRIDPASRNKQEKAACGSIAGGSRTVRIGVLANTTWYLFNFRLNLLRALRDAGYQAIAIGPVDGYESQIEAAGFRHVVWSVKQTGTHPLDELGCVNSLRRILKSERLDALLSYTPKGNIYAALAARQSHIPVIANVSGLGQAFIRHSPLTWLVRGLYWLTFRRLPWVFFQNREDMAWFVRQRLVNRDKIECLPGSGVDIRRFIPAPGVPHADASALPFVFLMAARLLWDKGIGEYVEAARRIRRTHPATRFQLLGFLDSQHGGSVSRTVLESWTAEGVVEYLGATDDVLPFLHAADCVVLPSYREGMPRILLEAASVAKPVIAADSPGCRDALVDGVTGLLCKPRDSSDLADRMLSMLSMPPETRREMGRQGRLRMQACFDENHVLARYLAVLRRVTAHPDLVGAEAERISLLEQNIALQQENKL
jgi:glycosyltransferase involved in cell wall biosynthesis